MLYVIEIILSIEADELQEKMLSDISNICEDISIKEIETRIKIDELETKIKNRDKLSETLLKQLSEARKELAKIRDEKVDTENNLEFVTNNIEDEKLKEVIVAQNK